MGNDFEAPALPQPGARQLLVLLTGFTAALCWWIGIVGLVNTGGGAYLFLGIPAVLTIGTLLLMRRDNPKAKHRGLPDLQDTHNRLSPQRWTIVLLCGFSTALCWWIGIVGLVNTGGGAYLFLGLPALLTLGTLIVWRHGQHRRGYSLS